MSERQVSVVGGGAATQSEQVSPALQDFGAARRQLCRIVFGEVFDQTGGSLTKMVEQVVDVPCVVVAARKLAGDAELTVGEVSRLPFVLPLEGDINTVNRIKLNDMTGGDLRIESTPGRGTRVTILLPCSDLEQTVPQETQDRALDGGRTGSVLLVEDNEAVGEFAEALLRELGHRVVRTKSGSEALEVVKAAPFDVVLSDVVMPGMSGLELADTLATLRPQLPVILTTGYSDEISRSGAGGRPVLLKPYRLEALASVIDETLRAPLEPTSAS